MSAVAPSADVSADAWIGDGARVWHLAQVRENARIGELRHRARRVHRQRREVGDNCKIQNYALVYEPATLGDGVFIGPAVVLTNDHVPPRGQSGRLAEVGRTTGSRSA